eukprot:scaffold3275_cov385-Prasinococcus_capsulatus_cf.AAC.15
MACTTHKYPRAVQRTSHKSGPPRVEPLCIGPPAVRCTRRSRGLVVQALSGPRWALATAVPGDPQYADGAPASYGCPQTGLRNSQRPRVRWEALSAQRCGQKEACYAKDVVADRASNEKERQQLAVLGKVLDGNAPG